MIGRVYTAIGTHNGLAGDKELVQITAPADKVVVIRRVLLGQDSSTTADQVRAVIQRASSAGSGGSALTPEAFDPGSAAASSTVLAENTTPATLSGSPLVSQSFDARATWLFVLDPNAPIVLAGQDVAVLRMEDGPTTAADFTSEIEFAEIG